MAKSLARRLGYTYIDTGAMYRGVTLFSLRNGLWDEAAGTPHVGALVDRLHEISLRFQNVEGANHLILNGEDVEAEIRGMAVSNKVSPISTIPEVRAFLVRQQQEMAAAKGVVMDGRDIGTVVLPDAELKVFVTASPEVRAQRRYDELRAQGKEVSYEEVYDNVTTRDRIDSTRVASPLRQADDAVLLDNSALTREEQDAMLYGMYTDVVRSLSGDDRY